MGTHYVVWCALSALGQHLIIYAVSTPLRYNFIYLLSNIIVDGYNQILTPKLDSIQKLVIRCSRMQSTRKEVYAKNISRRHLIYE